MWEKNTWNGREDEGERKGKRGKGKGKEGREVKSIGVARREVRVSGEVEYRGESEWKGRIRGVREFG
ncbi:MAG: hypothetical protein ACTS4U_00060 [Candidatus Hodgkinia cicadicola]